MRAIRKVGGGALPVAVALSVVALAAACGAPDGETADDDTSSGAWTETLVAELREMGRVDQEVRRALEPAMFSDTAFLGRMARADSAHSRRLRELVARHGWPRATEVGEEAAEAAFLVVQHSPFDAWQREMLPRVEAAVRAGELDPQDYALLFDRVRVKADRPQRYGTQLDRGSDGRLYLEPLEDTAAVDSLRSELGLPPLDAYFDLLEEATGMTVAREGIGS